jgi:putative tricarboxylic transport membrane protein
MSDRLLGAACIAVSAAMAVAARGYAPPISYEPVGPSAFPLLLSGLMAAGGAWLLVRPSLRGAAVYRGVPIKPTVLCAVALLVYALLFEWLGFAAATTVMALPIGLAFGGNWKQALAGGAGLGIALFFLFDKLLDVVLPTGALSFLLGGH